MVTSTNPADFLSANGKMVRIGVEAKSTSGIFGRDWISGGLRDYFNQYREGFWVIVKADIHPSNVGELVREGIRSELGTYPITMPETYASHLNVLLWEGSSILKEEELLLRLGGWIEHSRVDLDEKRAKQGEVKNQVEIERRLAELKEKHAAGERNTFSYNRVEQERLLWQIQILEEELLDEDERNRRRAARQQEQERTESERLVFETRDAMRYWPEEISALKRLEKKGKEKVVDEMSVSYTTYHGSLDALIRKGLVKKVGHLNKFYELTEEGRRILLDSRG
jgi:predicted transcriptional regulator